MSFEHPRTVTNVLLRRVIIGPKAPSKPQNENCWPNGTRAEEPSLAAPRVVDTLAWSMLVPARPSMIGKAQICAFDAQLRRNVKKWATPTRSGKKDAVNCACEWIAPDQYPEASSG